MTLCIVALDPGGSTGWATYKTERSDYMGSFQTGTFYGPMPHHAALWKMLDQLLWEAGKDGFFLVCESFEYRNRARPGLELISREYIGIARLLGALHGEVQYVPQTAGLGKGFVADRNIQRLGLWEPGRNNRHQMDAMRHLLYFIVHGKGSAGEILLPTVRDELLRKGWRGD